MEREGEGRTELAAKAEPVLVDVARDGEHERRTGRVIVCSRCRRVAERLCAERGEGGRVRTSRARRTRKEGWKRRTHASAVVVRAQDDRLVGTVHDLLGLAAQVVALVAAERRLVVDALDHGRQVREVRQLLAREAVRRHFRCEGEVRGQRVSAVVEA